MKDMILLVDKPSGMSSFGVVARVRRKLTEQLRRGVAAQGQNCTMPKRVKVGHAGTLDPFATGLMIVLTGKNTKRATDFLKLDKEYEATVRLGARSTTGDPEGIITEQEITQKPNKQAVENVVENLIGENWQKVPEYSAVKIQGQRAYKLARAGKKVEMPVRKVMIYEIELLDYQWPLVRIRCKVSSGTYIRALGEELGERLGTGGYVTELRRTQVGQFRIEEAWSLEQTLTRIEEKGLSGGEKCAIIRDI